MLRYLFLCRLFSLSFTPRSLTSKSIPICFLRSDSPVINSFLDFLPPTLITSIPPPGKVRLPSRLRLRYYYTGFTSPLYSLRTHTSFNLLFTTLYSSLSITPQSRVTEVYGKFSETSYTTLTFLKPKFFVFILHILFLNGKMGKIHMLSHDNSC